MGDITALSRGTVISKDYLQEHAGPYPVYSSQTLNSGIFGWIDSYAYDFESITWTTDGANAGSVFYHNEEKFTITNVCGLIRVTNPSEVSTRYLAHVLRKLAPAAVYSGMGNPKLMSNQMAKIKVPIPIIDTQVEIAEILDGFAKLTSDFVDGLPAEIQARRKQYEFYRDKLLTFKELD